MKTKTIKLYDYSELSAKAKERAMTKWQEAREVPFLQSHMINLLKEELEERGIKYDTDSIDVRYSLSYCQGDGFMFEGELEFEGYNVKIKHSGHYCHSYSKSVDITDKDGNEFETMTKAGGVYERFEALYQEICKKMERTGYDEIEYQTSEEVFEQECELAGWTFREDGRMENED